MNFTFGKRVEQVDWRKLAAVDLDRLTRDMDVKTLQENIMNITYCNIEAELGMHAVGFDPNFIKLFNLAQLIIEYLLHSQEYLSSNLESEVKKVQEAMQSAEEVRKELEQKSESQSKLKKENKRLKKWIAEYQLMMRAGSSGIHKCPHCAKAFVSQEYLSAHLSRRHHGDSTHMNGFLTTTKPDEVSPKGVTNGEVDPDKLALLDEMKQIKERLYATERELMNERDAREMNSAKEKDQVLNDQSKLKEMESNYERWRRQEEDKHQREMDYLRDSLMQQMEEVKLQNQEEKRTFTQAITDLKNDLNKRPSMIGSIKDEDEPDGIPSGPSKEEIAIMMREQFDQMKQQSQEERQREIKKMNQKWKAKEDKLEMDHQNEMNRLHELLAQYKDKVKNYDIEREQLKKLLKERNRQVEEKKIIAEQLEREEQQQQVFEPPPAPKREVTFSDELLDREQAKTPDFKDSQDSLTLYVAANINRSQYRLWRQRSEGSSEWVDKFFFHAYIQPVGPFTTPIYVHSASGSPYWRQCITGSSNPPSNEYHLDYMFYASQNPVLGAVQLHVLDAGSLPVLRSCVYKSKELSGWKYKRLSFYVMKSNQAVGTLSSSWDGDQESEESESELEEVEKVNEVMRESLDSTADSKDLTSGLSSSEWGTETLQRGEFHPFPNNPSITTHYDHTHDEVMACRQEIEQMLEQKLIKQGVQPSIGRLSSEKLEARMQALALERQARSKKMRNFDELRSRGSQELEDMAKKNYKEKATRFDTEAQLDPRYGGKSPVARSKPPTMRAAATAVRASTSMQQQSLKASTRSSATLSSTGSQDTGLTTGESFSGTSVTERTLSESGNEEDYSDSEDVSEWDSTGGYSPMGAPSSSRTHQPFPTNPKVSVRIPTHEVDSDPEEIQPVARGSSNRQQKDNLRERVNTLERSLGSSGPGKKPLGGVALPGKQDDDFDDDSDFTLSSVEEKTKPAQITRAEMNRTGPRSESTPVPAPRSRPLPSPRSDIPKQSTSAVEAFSIDDYSDFDDSDLETHHL